MPHSICQQIWKIWQWPQDWKRSVFILIPKKGNAKECSNYRTIALISHTSKVMLKILQVRLQQYINWELPEVQARLRKDRGTRDQVANICWIIEKKSSRKTSASASLTKAFVWVTCGKFLKELGIPDHLTCLLRNMYADQEAIARTWHGTAECFQIGKGVLQVCTSSPCLFNLFAEYIMQNDGLNEV